MKSTITTPEPTLHPRDFKRARLLDEWRRRTEVHDLINSEIARVRKATSTVTNSDLAAARIDLRWGNEAARRLASQIDDELPRLRFAETRTRFEMLKARDTLEEFLKSHFPGQAVEARQDGGAPCV